MTRLTPVLAALTLALVAFFGDPAAAERAPRKMAMILPGTIQDADFNTVGYLALQDVAKTYGLEVSHSESVAVADAERVSREYLGAGYDIIAYHGGQYPTIMKKLAGQFPQAVFIQEASGRLPDAPANAWVLGRRYHEGFYVLGALAALATETGKVGLVGGVRIPDVIASTNSVQQALRDYNPSAELIYNHIGDFNDPVRARQTAEAQIGAGADVIISFVNLGFYGVVEAAKASPRPVWLTTFYTEKWNQAPGRLTVSLLFDFAKPYREIVGRILKGERSGYFEMRPGSGIELSEIRHLPPAVSERVRAVFADVVTRRRAVPEITDRVVRP